MGTEDKPGNGSGVIELARKWLSYPEEIRKQVYDWERLDAIAHEELEAISEILESGQIRKISPAKAPFGTRFGYRGLSLRQKGKTEIVPIAD